MARHFTRGRGRLGAVRRETIWADIVPVVTDLGAASTAQIINTGGAALLALRPFTVIRSRGFFYVSSDQIGASEAWGASLGMAVVSDEAVAIGATAVPTPETDASSDLWFVYETTYGQFTLHTSVGAYERGVGRTYDSKAMRRVEDGQDLIIVVETPTIVSSARIQHRGRLLLKLH